MEKIRRRHRVSKICALCRQKRTKCDRKRPSCETCLKAGVACQYPERQMSSLLNSSREELYAQIMALRSELFQKHSPTAVPDSNDDDSPVDFYDYNSISVKTSSHEEQKPLCADSICKKDHYVGFYYCYMFIFIRHHYDFLNSSGKNWRSRHPDGGSKWLVLLSNTEKNSQIQEAVQRLCEERFLTSKTSVLPFLGLEPLGDGAVRKLKQEIEDVLPSKTDVHVYLDFFKHFIWPIRPFMYREKLEQDIERIITYHQKTQKPKVIIQSLQDWTSIGTILIILRYSSTCLSFTEFKQKPRNPISVKAISIATTCLSLFVKTSLERLQALMYLRSYFKDAPEDGDGRPLEQSQFIFGTIVQYALALGLHVETGETTRDCNLKRKIWYEILRIDRSVAISSGALIVAPDEPFFNVELPSTDSEDLTDLAIEEEISKSYPLFRYYSQISYSVNDLKNKTTLGTLENLLQKTRTYTDRVYAFSSLIVLEEKSVFTIFDIVNIYRNSRILEFQMQQLMVEHTIYYLLCLFYESNAGIDIRKFKIYFRKSLETASRMIDLSIAYLTGSFEKYTRDFYNYTISPLINNISIRLINFTISLSLRCYHAQDLLQSPYFYKAPTTKADQQSLENLVVQFTSHYKKFFALFEKSCGIRYYQSAKTLAFSKVGLDLLLSNRFKMMSKVIKFLKTDEICNDDNNIFNIPLDKRDLMRQKLQKHKNLANITTEWMHLNSIGKKNNESQNRDTIININNSNLFLEFSTTELEQCADMIKNHDTTFFGTIDDLTENYGNLFTDEIIAQFDGIISTAVPLGAANGAQNQDIPVEELSALGGESRTFDWVEELFDNWMSNSGNITYN